MEAHGGHSNSGGAWRHPEVKAAQQNGQAYHGFKKCELISYIAVADISQLVVYLRNDPVTNNAD